MVVAVMTVLPRDRLARMNGCPVTPGGSVHGVTEVSRIRVPGGPDPGVELKLADSAPAAGTAKTVSTVPRKAAVQVRRIPNMASP
jgi:hypothetical protein